MGPVRPRRQGVRRPQEGTWRHRSWQPRGSCVPLTNTFLGECYRRIARRRGNKRAVVAVGRSILIIIWQLLSDPEAQLHDLGPDFYATRLGADRTK